MINLHKIFSESFPTALQPLAEKLYERLEEGHICIDLKKEDYLLENIPEHKQLLRLKNPSEIEYAEPFVLFDNKIYFHRYFQYENTILSKIEGLNYSAKFQRNARKESLLNKSEIFNKLFENNGSALNLQAVAAISTYLNNFSIITGGPGTGKTTTVAKLLSLLYLENADMKVAVAAPTGKASARLNEVFKSFKSEVISENIITKINKLEAKTIHRLLGGYQQFRHNADNPLDIDLLIVDECSMIDAALMAKMMSALAEGVRLILLGDKNQLSSVEAGSIFTDLCVAGLHNGNEYSSDFATFLRQLDLPYSSSIKTSSTGNPISDAITELNFSHRFKESEGIGNFSRLAISGNEEEFDYGAYTEKNQNNQFVKISDTIGLKIEEHSDFKMLLNDIKAYIKEDDLLLSFAKLNSFKILCATRDGKFGTHNINRLIEANLGLKIEKKDFYHKQPILITKNNPDLDINNGDIGIIINKNHHSKSIEGLKSEEKLSAFFEIKGKIVEIPLMYITDFETAFAMTIHKSQGSEYDKVFVFFPNNPEHPLLTRELMYTAVTRAKSACYVYASENVIRNCIRKQIKRVSGITDRLISRG